MSPSYEGMYAATKRTYCDVYWGTHGCRFDHGHSGPCECDCCECERHPDLDSGCVAKPPYYGADTEFYGDHVEERGLPRGAA